MVEKEEERGRERGLAGGGRDGVGGFQERGGDVYKEAVYLEPII